MKFEFDANQPYQLRAIASAVELFQQQPLEPPTLRGAGGAAVIPNILRLDETTILQNLQAVQEQNGLGISTELKGWDFSVEMETGTGKTYIYLRTMLELHKRYGFRKFIIIVPSIAIREGVLKTMQITREHFEEIYDGQPYRCAVYQSNKLSQLRQFALSDSMEILIMTIDSFNKDINVIHNYSDRLAGARPIDLIRATHPILILDEPQNMESEKARLALGNLNPLFTLRYSATHRHYYNLIYRLTPHDAYQMGLVKQIEVYSITEAANDNEAAITVTDIFRKNGKLLTRLSVNARDHHGAVRNKVYQFQSGDSLYSRTKLPVYKNWIVSEINLREKRVGFSNGQTLRLGQIRGSDRHLIMKQQMAVAIREHFEKRGRLRKQGIKNLTLFFIDRVENYASPRGWIRKYFEKTVREIKQEFDAPIDMNAAELHCGYFSKKKTEKVMQQDKEAFDLIMRDKERLLSLDEPVEFIFSHSALREGWDNPNVFNICTLNYSHSEIKKRQEIGRGIRLCVNQQGKRILDQQVNRLTVIANENYADYVARLQSEYDEEYGQGVPKPRIHNAALRRQVAPSNDFHLNPHFQKIWHKISHQTSFRIRLNRGEFIKRCIKELDRIKVSPSAVMLTRARAEVRSGKFGAVRISERQLAPQKGGGVSIRQLVDDIQLATGLTRNTVIALLSETTSINHFLKNPSEYSTRVIEMLREILVRHINEGIRYQKSGSLRDFRDFKEFEGYENQMMAVTKTVYPLLAYADNGEKAFISMLEDHERVMYYIKLPAWFAIRTPYGGYSPGWAMLINRGNRAGVMICDFHPSGRNNAQMESKQICARRHFDAIGVEYMRSASWKDLLKRLQDDWIDK